MKKYLLASVMLAALGATASAATINWDFTVGGTIHDQDIGISHTFSQGGFNVIATGFDGLGNTTDLFDKHNGGDENGLGLNADPTGNGEIFGTPVTPNTFIQLDVTQARLHGASGFNFSMGSTTQGEAWTVFGSNTWGGLSWTPLLSETNDEGVNHALAGGFNFYDFVYTGPVNGSAGGDNVLLSSFAGVASGVPEPSTWAMGLVGFAFVGMLGLVKTRRAPISIVG